MDATERHTLFVTWSKIVLPLAGIGLLSAMFLLARDEGEGPAIPFSEIEAIAREQRISSPRFSGTADDGSVVSIRADSIRPNGDRPDAFAITELRAGIDAADGSRIDITAGMGELDPRRRTARISGLARVVTSSGYEMETEGLLADFGSGVVTSLGPLEVRAPYGQLTAQEMEIAVAPDGTGQRMVFKGGVRLVYLPLADAPAPGAPAAGESTE